MKIQILIVTVLTFLSFQIFGQQKNYHLDTLIIDINEGLIVKIANFENGWLNHYDGFSSRIEHFQQDLSKIQSELPLNKNFILVSNKIGQIEVKQNGDSQIFIIDSTVDSFRQCRAVIETNKYEIIIDFMIVSDLINTDIQKYINMAANNEAKTIAEYNRIDDYSEKKHKGVAFNIYYSCDKDTVILDPDLRSHYNPHKSQLEIAPQIGVGALKIL